MKMKLTCLARLMICCAAQARQPNIIYIITDDWGIGKVPCYKVDPASQNIIKAPNPDRLRVQGMLFTNADAGGHPITGDMDGISIMPTLSSNPEKQAQREYLYFEFYEKARQQSVRMGNWKLPIEKEGREARLSYMILARISAKRRMLQGNIRKWYIA
jgi:hypothetical protein